MTGSSAMHEAKAHLRKVASVLSVVWAAGAVGGFAYWLIGPLFQALRILEYSGVDLHYSLDRPSLYAHLTWGGAWGLLFLLTLPKSMALSSGTWQFWLRAILYGLAPALVEIFLVLPHDGHGVGGTDYGAATWVFVLLFNTLGWSVPAYCWLYLIGPEDGAQGFGYDALAGSV